MIAFLGVSPAHHCYLLAILPGRGGGGQRHRLDLSHRLFEHQQGDLQSKALVGPCKGQPQDLASADAKWAAWAVAARQAVYDVQHMCAAAVGHQPGRLEALLVAQPATFAETCTAGGTHIVGHGDIVCGVPLRMDNDFLQGHVAGRQAGKQAGRAVITNSIRCMHTCTKAQQPACSQVSPKCLHARGHMLNGAIPPVAMQNSKAVYISGRRLTSTSTVNTGSSVMNCRAGQPKGRQAARLIRQPTHWLLVSGCAAAGRAGAFTQAQQAALQPDDGGQGVIGPLQAWLAAQPVKKCRALDGGHIR